MKSIFDLIKQDDFTRTDLKDIITFWRIEGDISPLCAIAFISGDQKVTNEDISTFCKLLAKYPKIAAKF